MTQIELSQAELDLIQAKREEEAAKEVEKQTSIRANIQKAKVHIAKRLEECVKQRAAAEAFQKELGEGWIAHTNTHKSTEKVYWDMDLVWEEDYAWDNVYLKKGDYTVSVYMHSVYNTAWGRGTSKGYKMFLSGPEIEYAYRQKALSKAATVNKKVNECIEVVNAREEFKKKKASALETAVSDMRAKFPNAEVTTSKDWTRGYGKSGYREYNKLVVKLTNGIEVHYEVQSDGSLNRLNVLFSCKDEIALIGALGAIQLPSTKK